MNRTSVSPPAIPPSGSPSNMRHFGASTDDAAIFLEDTMDRPTAQCISASPSAMAILSPQRAPAHAEHVDVTEYDAAHLGSARKSGSGGGALQDVTNLSGAAVRLNFGKSPTPKMNRLHSSSLSRSAQRPASHSAARAHGGHSAARLSGIASTPASKYSTGMQTPGAASVAEPTISLSEYERLERERNRFQKMYEHQKVLYEEMSEKHSDTYQKLQDRIVEVVALSTRNEESKRFIRQLKKEMSESRTRVMNMQNRVLEDQRTDRLDRSRYEAMLDEQDRKYERMVERHEAKMAGLESLLKDLTCIKEEHGAVHVAQLDSLLRASYSKSTALFSDLLRQGRQIDYFYDNKADLELQLDELRKEKREMEARIAEERRHMMYQTERFAEQIEEQQESILSLRQMLIRTMASIEDAEEEEDGEASFGSRSSSFHSMSDEEEYEADADTDFVNSARTARGGSDDSGYTLKDNAIVHASKSEDLGLKRVPGAADAASRDDDSAPAFLSERARNRPLLTSVVRRSTEGDGGEEDDDRTHETTSTSTTTTGGSTRTLRRSQGRQSAGSAKSVAALIASAGTRRVSTGSYPHKDTAALSDSTTRQALARSDSAPSSVSMTRRKSDGLFAPPMEKVKPDTNATTTTAAATTTTQSRGSAKKLDFSTALAAVAEIRERTRQARASTERREDDEADKENSRTERRHTAISTKRSTAAKDTAKIKAPAAGVRRILAGGGAGRGGVVSSNNVDDDDDEDSVPRLTPHSRAQANTLASAKLAVSAKKTLPSSVIEVASSGETDALEYD